MKSNEVSDGTFEKVKVDTLDKVIEQISPNKLSFIKCDVEGKEFDVFKGGEKTITKYKPVILVEIWIEKRTICNELSNFLRQCGYIEKCLYKGELTDFDFGFVSKNHLQDFFFIPEGKIGDDLIGTAWR